MDFYIVIPAYNEEAFLEKTLQSLLNQTLPPKQIIVVNDNSTDSTQKIIAAFEKEHPTIKGVKTNANSTHSPGSKVINAFNEGLTFLDESYDVLCKFDADLIFPANYLAKVSEAFQENPLLGITGGHCTIEHNGKWIVESLTNKNHIRGALKAYKKECLQQIEFLKPTMGWDTVDELLAQHKNWKVTTIDNLHVKHLKPTGNTYTKKARFKQGQAFKKMRYGFILTLIASAKLAIKKRSFSYFFNCILGFINYKGTYIVSREEGVFIRSLRWKGIREKLW